MELIFHSRHRTICIHFALKINKIYPDYPLKNDKNEVLKLRAEACLNSLPAQLSKEYKKFQYSLVDVKGHSPEKADGLQYAELYYFHASSGSPELDFLYEKDGEVGIIECKASNNRATSMKFVIANSKKYGVHPAVKIADSNVGGGEGFYTYPLYSLGFIQRQKKQKIIDLVDVKNIKVPE